MVEASRQSALEVVCQDMQGNSGLETLQAAQDLIFLDVGTAILFSPCYILVHRSPNVNSDFSDASADHGALIERHTTTPTVKNTKASAASKAAN